MNLLVCHAIIAASLLCSPRVSSLSEEQTDVRPKVISLKGSKQLQQQTMFNIDDYTNSSASGWLVAAAETADRPCCFVEVRDALVPTPVISSFGRCASLTDTRLELRIKIHAPVVPQIWKWIKGSSRLLTCPNGGQIVLGRDDDGVIVGQKEGKTDSHETVLLPTPRTLRQTTQDQDPHADHEEERILIPNAVHPINCMNKAATDDQTNGSPIAAEERMWNNISLMLEYQPVSLVSGSTLIMIRAAHQKLKLRCKVFASPLPVMVWQRVFVGKEQPLVLGTENRNMTAGLLYKTRIEENGCWAQSTLDLVIEREQDLGTYICNSSNGHGTTKMSFIIKANSKKIFSERDFNSSAFITGMIPPVVVCILFIMKLGYRSRYASTAAEEEALEEERLAYETNNVNIFT